MAASTTRVEKQQQGDSRQAAAASFDAMHDALASEAHVVARDFGIDVLTVAFRPDHTADRADDSRRRPRVPRRRADEAGATAGPQGHPRPPGAGDDDGEETGAQPPVESRSISSGAVRSKAAEDFEGRKKEKKT
jgi:hypothetical protein